MVNRRSRNPRKTQRIRRPVRRIGRMINRRAHGFEIVPSNDPPAFVSAPWWPMTVNLKSVKDEYYVPKDIYTAIIAQLQWGDYKLPSDPKEPNKVLTIPLEMRILSVRMWGLGQLPCQLMIYDHLGGKHPIAEITDYGTRFMYSKVGWKFGNVAVLDAVERDDPDTLFRVSGASASNNILVYVQVLIRAIDAAKPVLLQNPATLSELVNDIVMV